MDITVTNKEKTILDLVVKGLSNQQISEAMKISMSNVKNTLTGIYKKFGVKSRAQLIILLL